MAYQRLFSLKSHDYMLDHREDELIWEYVKFSVDLTAGNGAATGTAEVPTTLDEVRGIINLGFLAALTSTDQTIDMITDGGISDAKITVNVNTINVITGTYEMHCWIVGKLAKRVELA